MKNVITILGGVLTIVSMFLAFASGGGISITGMDYVKLADGAWVAYAEIGGAALIIICGLMGKKPLNILSLLLGLGITAMAIKYKMDIGADAAIGLWMMIGGGALAVIGSVMAMMKKTA